MSALSFSNIMLSYKLLINIVWSILIIINCKLFKINFLQYWTISLDTHTKYIHDESNISRIKNSKMITLSTNDNSHTKIKAVLKIGTKIYFQMVILDFVKKTLVYSTKLVFAFYFIWMLFNSVKFCLEQ